MPPLIESNRDQIGDICRRFRVKRLELFGSAARGDFDPRRSDVDLFYEFDTGDDHDLADRFFAMKAELETLLDTPVDLISRCDVTNPFFLAVADRYRQLLYAA